jgi:preprotein translocase subunit SecG
LDRDVEVFMKRIISFLFAVFFGLLIGCATASTISYGNPDPGKSVEEQNAVP